MPISQHLITQDDGSIVELFQAASSQTTPRGAILFVHGNQGGRLIGAWEAVDTGMLERYSTALRITAAAVSQPGFGRSDGPPDFCGPKTQRAINTALAFLRGQPLVDPERLVLFGNSRGAIASAMVATQDADLRGLVLSSGVYDLRAAYDAAAHGLRGTIAQEAGLSEEAFSKRSALYHAGAIRCETLLLHGRQDDRALVSQAERLDAALTEAGVSTALHIFDCGHRIPGDLSRPALRPFLRRMFGPADQRTLH